jgi:DNA-binding XRE family transcriptional regulator
MTPAVRSVNGKEHEGEASPAVPAFSPPRMRGYRHVRQFTHDQVAESIGTTAQTSEEYESGDRVPEPAIVTALATLLGCAYGDLTTTGDPFDNRNYWEAACAALPPLTERAINSIAATLDRIDARNATQSAG